MPDTPESGETEDRDRETEETNDEPKAHKRSIEGVEFQCQPISEDATPDPARGKEWRDQKGRRFWCTPYEKYWQQEYGRRYDSRGRIDPNIVD